MNYFSGLGLMLILVAIYATLVRQCRTLERIAEALEDEDDDGESWKGC